MPFCESCGVEGGGDYCAACGQVRSFAAVASQRAVVVAQPQQVATTAPATHGVPALISFFIPALGQLIKGHVAKAFVVWMGLLGALIGGFVFPLVWLTISPAIWVWQVMDAYLANKPHIEILPWEAK